MDNLRLILFFALALVSLMLWNAWQEDYGPKSAGVDQGAEQTTATAPGAEALPSAADGDIPAVSSSSTIDDASGDGAPAPTQVVVPQQQIIKVETDLLAIEIDSAGGTLRSLHLKGYPDSVEAPEQKFQLMKPQKPNLFIAQTGIMDADIDRAPTHKTLFQAAKPEYLLEDGQDRLTVDLTWTHASGLKVTKSYIFTRGSYLIEHQQRVENGSSQTWKGREYRQLLRSPEDKETESTFLYTYTGGAIYSPEEKYEKIDFDEMEEKNLDRDVRGGWVGMLQHYFFAAWIPPAEEQNNYYSNALSGERYRIGAYTPQAVVEPGASHTFSTGLIVGPKLQDQLRDIAPGLDLTVDYGWLTILAQPIFWLLSWIHALLGNWGWSIIVLTILIKLAFYKLSETSYKSMANMRRMTPRMQALKDRYGDDKERLNKAMMDLYKTEKINPLGGCLPILIQIPVFIALYWVLLEAVELRQAPFILWIDDLSIKDPYFILPLIMGVSMFIQQKLNPAPPDPMQAKIMMSLPFVFTVFFAFFPSGLVLYWVVNNILSIAQQWYITRKIEQAHAT
jgi:YidC/Oxa1 family membrane protein insertase